MPIAYSYARVSTPEQKKGLGIKRQISDETKQLAISHGFEFDENLIIDEGRSGYHGNHIKGEGKLGKFLTLIQTGEIAAGSRLYVEHLDRLSRQKPTLAQAQFLMILNHGVEIYTTMDHQLYTDQRATENPGILFLSLGVMMGNHSQSEAKSKRTKDNWRAVRGTTSALAPSWIIRDKDGFKVDEAKANIVRRLFKDLLTTGMERLARVLNDEGVPTLGGRKLSRSAAKWDASSIAQIVRSRKALGEQSIGRYENGVRHDTGECVINAYPAVVSESQWFAVQQALDKRKKGVEPLDGRKRLATNLFGDLARCSVCGNRMVVQTRGKGTHLYLACSMGKLHQCTATKYHRLDQIERAVRELFAEAALLTEVKPCDDPAGGLQRELDDLRASTARLETEYEKLFDAYGLEPIGSPERKALDKRSAQLKANAVEIKRLESAVAAKRAEKPASDQFAVLRELVIGLDELPDAERITTRQKIASALPHVVKSISFDADGSFTVMMTPQIAIRRLQDNLPSERFRKSAPHNTDYRVTEFHSKDEQMFCFTQIPA